MATVTKSCVRVEVRANITLELSEDEARALDAIFGYNVDAFLGMFYERMGRAYVQPHESGVRSLHKTMRGILAGPLSNADEARKALSALRPDPSTKTEVRK